MDTQPVKSPLDDTDFVNDHVGEEKDEAKASTTKFVSVKTGRVFEKHPCLQCGKVFSSGRGVQMHLLLCKVSTEQVAQPPTNVVDSVVVGKKRGRPSKAGKVGTVRMAVAGLAVGEVPAGQRVAVDSVGQTGGKGETTIGMVKKARGRGRPPKIRKIETVEDQQAAAEGETSGTAMIGRNVEGERIKQRGRPVGGAATEDGVTRGAAANDDGGTGGAAADDDGGTGVRIDQGKDRHAKKTVGETSQVEADENEAIV